jgi:hypothetical protein
MEVVMLVSSIPILAISPTFQLVLGLFSLRQALQDLKDLKDHKALPGLQAIRDLKDHKAIPDHRGFKDHKEPKAKQALPGVPEWASTPSR